jgi:tRNA(fMet)-specific endonuclease VapC
MSVAELKRWALSRRWGADKRRILSDAISKCVVVPFDEPMADAWAQIADHRSRMGRPIECGDCWIAATAVRHSLPLVSHNGKHYADIPGLRLISRPAAG